MWAVVTLAICASIIAVKAHANPIVIPPQQNCKTAVATSTMTALATSSISTTLTCDAYNLSPYNVDPTGVVSASLAVQYDASSTAGILTIALQFSNDNIDWYENQTGNLDASSTGSQASYPAKTISLTPATTSPIKKVYSVPFPARYVRAIFTGTALSGTSTVWAEFWPLKQAR